MGEVGLIVNFLKCLISKKCYICQKSIRGMLLHRVTRSVKVIKNRGIYGSPIVCREIRERVYHDSCLKNVLASPEKFGNAVTDRAIHISECIEDEKERKRARKAEIEKDSSIRQERLEKARKALTK